jgi:NAD(P)-dependent dehydrogenase (short-subunit alcohol dehydrogenase family)
MLDFNDKSVLITGGSRGLGRALAPRSSAEGAKVALVACPQAELNETVKDIRRSGGGAYGIVAGVGNKESVYPIVGQAAPVDPLINNASPLGLVPLRLIPDPDCENFERALQVNTIGSFRLIKAMIGSMILRQTAVIVNNGLEIWRFEI